MSPAAEHSSASGSGNTSSSGNTPASTSTNNTSSGNSQASPSNQQDDTLVCKWNQCNQTFPSAEALYDHLCERHVGRKSTNNLNLTCQWNSCKTTTVKRDHITSHIRVHVPLKPHKCDACGKAFKRPQDLKKHQKTHADDSVIQGQNQQSGSYRGQQPSGAPNNGFYGSQGQLRANPPFGVPQAGPPNYYSGAPQPSQNFLYMTGTQNQFVPGRDGYMGQGTAPTVYSAGSKRGPDFGELLGSMKSAKFDNNSYAAIRGALDPLQGIASMPMSVGPTYMTAAPVHAPMPVPLQTYALPQQLDTMAKGDLLNLQTGLDEWRNVVYEASDFAQGVIKERGEPAIVGSQSPPLSQRIGAGAVPATNQSIATTMAAAAASPISTTSIASTPVMTPPSSAVSYTSGNSPSPSLGSASPAARPSSISYPSLPHSVSGAFSHPAHSSPSLGPQFETKQMRINNTNHQRAANTMPRSVPSPLVPETSKSPTSKAGSPPAARSPSADSDSSERDLQYVDWVETIRTIEHLQRMVKEALEKRGGELKAPDAMDVDTPKARSPQPELKKEEEEIIKKRAEIKYPKLPALI